MQYVPHIGDEVALEYRISADEFVAGAPTVEETIEFAKMIEDRIDLLHVSAGNLYVAEAGPRMIQPIYVPRGINVQFSARFKQELSIPVTAVGSITMDMAEEIVSQNQADIVAMIRSIIADPDCVRKAEGGRAGDIRPCVRCNRCVSETREYTRPTRCTVNPVAGREVEFLNPEAPAERRGSLWWEGDLQGWRPPERQQAVATKSSCSRRRAGWVELSPRPPLRRSSLT